MLALRATIFHSMAGARPAVSASHHTGGVGLRRGPGVDGRAHSWAARNGRFRKSFVDFPLRKKFLRNAQDTEPESKGKDLRRTATKPACPLRLGDKKRGVVIAGVTRTWRERRPLVVAYFLTSRTPTSNIETFAAVFRFGSFSIGCLGSAFDPTVLNQALAGILPVLSRYLWRTKTCVARCGAGFGVPDSR